MLSTKRVSLFVFEQNKKKCALFGQYVHSFSCIYFYILSNFDIMAKSEPLSIDTRSQTEILFNEDYSQRLIAKKIMLPRKEIGIKRLQS